MLPSTDTKFWAIDRIESIGSWYWLIAFLAGALATLGFAPFHHPGAMLLSMSVLYTQLHQATHKQSWFIGLAFGLGLMSVGVSWVSVSIHLYGHLPIIAAIGITAVFVFYLALYPALCTLAYQYLAQTNASLVNALLFSSLWCISEYLRAHCFTGFPWLLLGFGQVDTPLKYLLPIVGIYGVSFLTVFAAAALSYTVRKMPYSFYWLITFVGILIAPACLKPLAWSPAPKHSLSISMIQANLSMRDKWDEALFWKIFEHYKHATEHFLGKKQLIILPESAIPLPASYVQEWLTNINSRAKRMGSAVLIGIPEESNAQQVDFYNTIIGLGTASGTYRKQQLVPFGEYIPKVFLPIMNWLALPQSNMISGPSHPALMTVNHHPFASLICYELAYPELLRQQLPKAQWIVSLSDDGWFGHSFALYQHVQMAQVFSILGNRYQIVANNSGLSSLINHQGDIIHTLPAHTSGILEGVIYPLEGKTPWMVLGDRPILIACWLIIGLVAIRKRLPT